MIQNSPLKPLVNGDILNSKIGSPNITIIQHLLQGLADKKKE